MASKGGGARASGTDGTDFAYRQRVDAKYQKAALTRKNLKKVLLGMCAYYPAMLAFALAPAIVVGHGVDQHNGPFAAGACGGMVLTVATYSHVSGKKLSGGWLRGVTRVLAMLGFINLAAGLAARALLQEVRGKHGPVVAKASFASSSVLFAPAAFASCREDILAGRSTRGIPRLALARSLRTG